MRIFDLPSSLWCLGNLDLMHMESFFLLYGIVVNNMFSHPFTSPVIYPCHLRGGGEASAWQTGWFHYAISSPHLLKESSLGASVCGNQLMLHTICESPLEGFYEGSHTRACLSLATRGWPPHPPPSPGLALFWGGKCLCFNRHNFQLSPCALEVSLSHPEQIRLFFFFFICSSELAAE